MPEDNVAGFSKAKRYTHFGELLKDASVHLSDVESGILVVFPRSAGMQLLPIASLEQIAYAAVKLAAFAADTSGVENEE